MKEIKATGTSQHEIRKKESSWRVRWMLAAVLVISYVLVSHTWAISVEYRIQSQQKYHQQENQIAARQKQVTSTSAVGYLLIGLTGVCCLVSGSRGKTRVIHPLNFMCLAYFAWCASSILWSQAASVGFRKVSIFALLLVGVVGMARKVKLEDLPWIFVLVSSVFLFYGVVAELAHGTFSPWKSGYRFTGTVHPNDQGLHAAILCLSATCLTWRNRNFVLKLRLSIFRYFTLLHRRSSVSK